MQGMQSSTVPEKMEKRGLTSATVATLEAAQRYLDRQTESEAALAAMEDDENESQTGASGKTEQGRPAWLRRWQGEAPPLGAGTTSGMRIPSTADRRSTAGSQDGDQDAAANGYTGQSIEAAFAFETIFHYETELEAGETEDWLELSGHSAPTEAVEPALLETEPGIEESGAEASHDSAGQAYTSRYGARDTASLEPSIQSAERSSAMGAGPDPQAVRAAIFRLAQESTHRWRPAQDLTEATVSSGTLKTQLSDCVPPNSITPTSVLEEAAATEGKLVDSPHANFAEVARHLWSLPEAANLSDPGRTSRVELKAAFSVLEDNPAAGGLEAFEGFESTAATQAPNESLPRPDESPRASSVSDHRGYRVLPVTNALPRSLVQERAVEAGMLVQETARSERATEDTRAKLEPDWTLNRALSEIRNEIRSEIRSEAKLKAAEAGSANTGLLPGSVPTSAAIKPRDTQGTASDAPALAHDASNLLSALKLYSELLALSGVLQARHSHYAQDLKLLAARSEVLIDRLLAACSLAERDARRLVKNHGLDAEASAVPERPSLEGAEISATSTAVPDGARPFSRETETGQDLSSHFAVKTSERLNGGEAEAPLLGAALSQRFEEPFMERGGTDAAEAGTTAAPDDGQGKIARLKGAEPGHTVTSDVDAEQQSGNDSINLIDLLTRWGSLLSMIARGPVEVKFGPQATLPIQVEEEAMERILVNLVHNAMTATRNGGAIRIGVGRAETGRPALSHPPSEGRARPASRMVLTVDDSGCGMSEQQIAKVLGAGRGPEPESDGVLEEGLPSGRRERRRGMGLQIVRELVAASGGDLAIYSRCGVGTRIEIRWPVLQRNADRELMSGHFHSPVTEDASLGPVLAEQRRPPQTANENGGATGGATHNRLRQGLEGAIAC